MKILLTILFFFYCLSISAQTTYYVDTSGSDAAAGTSAATAWKTIGKVNTASASFSVNTIVRFKRGQTFSGTITPGASGSSGNPIIYATYGTGANPKISGLTDLLVWSNLGSNIWEAACNSGNYLQTVLVNGSLTPMGRWPNYLNTANSGYRTNTNAGSSTQTIDITSGADTVNWTGAEMVVRPVPWAIHRSKITAQSGATITFTAIGTNVTESGCGYFIQNDPRTLNVQNEWWYQASTNKLRMYSTVNPNTLSVKAGTVEKLVSISSKNWITFDSLYFIGADSLVFEMASCQNITIRNSDFVFIGQTAINCNTMTNLVVTGNSFNHINSDGMWVDLANTNVNTTITSNTFTNIGLFPGMAYSNNDRHLAIYCKSTGSTIQYNNIDSVGGSGIVVFGSAFSVTDNFVNHPTQVVDDAGAIYTSHVQDSDVPPGGSGPGLRDIMRNIVGNGGSPLDGKGIRLPSSNGLYVDEPADHIRIHHNTSFNFPNAGIFWHRTANMSLIDNTIFNNAVGIISKNEVSPLIRNDTIRGNIFFAKYANQNLMEWQSPGTDIGSYGLWDSNAYVRPFSTMGTWVNQANNTTLKTYYDLPTWQALYSYDLNGYFGQTLAAYSGTPTGSNLVSASYPAYSSAHQLIAVTGTLVAGSAYRVRMTVTAASNAPVMIVSPLASDNFLQIADAGFVPAVTLARSVEFIVIPTRTIGMFLDVTQAGSVSYTINSMEMKLINSYVAKNPDDSIRFDYNATRVPVRVSLDKIYKDVRGVTNDSGRITLQPYSSVILFKGAALPAVAPVASAGTDIILELPTSSTGLTAAGSTDADGVVVDYEWIKLTGTGGSLSNANTSTPTASSLLQGFYTYELTVTDNNGNTDKDTVMVAVLPVSHKLTILKDYTYDLVGQVGQGGRGPDSLFDNNTTTHAVPNRFIAHPDSVISAFDGTKGIRYLLDLSNGNAVRRRIVKIRFFDASFSTDSFWVRKADTAFGNPNKLNGYTALVQTPSLPALVSAKANNSASIGGAWFTYYPTDTSARYIIIQLKNYQVDLSEAEIYCSDTDPTPVSLTYTDTRALDTASFAHRLGTNISGVYPDTLLKAVKHLREYEFAWYYNSDSVNAFPSNIININPFGSTYDSLVVSKGFKFAPSIRGTSLYVYKRQRTLYPTKPMDLGNFQPLNDIAQDPEDPHNYTSIANFYYKFMGVYGRNTSFNAAHLTNLINWDGTKAKGRYEYIEDGNEDEYPRGDSKYGNYWIGGYANPLTYFARSYASKNGWGGLLGSQMGAKVADPSVKFMMQGHYELHPDMIKTLAFLCKKFTVDSMFIWDVVNVHTYPRNLPVHADGGAPQGSEYVGVKRITADKDSLSTRLENFRKEVSRFIGAGRADTIEWALTEIGADINQQTPTSEAEFAAQHTITATPLYGSLDSLQSQAITLFRDYRHFNRTKWTFLNQYVFENPGGTQNTSIQNFGTSGLVTNTVPPSAEKTKHPSWYYHAQIQNYLSNYKYVSTASEGENMAVVDRYVHKSHADSVVYIVYKGSTNGTTASYNITGLPGATNAKRVVFSFNNTTGTESTVSITAGTLATTPAEIPNLFFINQVASNTAPDANAGVDQTIQLPTAGVSVSGSGSSDPDGTITAYAWTKISGPGTFNIISPSSVSTPINTLVQGVYVFRLTVTDDDGATDTDDVTITVTAAAVPGAINQINGKIIKVD